MSPCSGPLSSEVLLQNSTGGSGEGGGFRVSLDLKAEINAEGFAFFWKTTDPV